MNDASPSRRRGIQSVEVGMRVLAALASGNGPATLSGVAQSAGLSASQTHRYLSSLMAAGMARQDPASGMYDLAAGAIRIGLAALARLDIFARADTIFANFAQETGRTCLLAVWGDLGPTVVRWFAGYPPVITSLAIGSIMPLLRSATGRVFFAFGDRATMDAHAARELALANAPASDLAALRAKVRQDHAARVQGDLIPGLRAAGVPVFDLQGRLALVATTFAGGAPDPKADAGAERALIEACRRLTQTLGGRWPIEDFGGKAPVAGGAPRGRRRGPLPRAGQ